MNLVPFLLLFFLMKKESEACLQLEMLLTFFVMVKKNRFQPNWNLYARILSKGAFFFSFCSLFILCFSTLRGNVENRTVKAEFVDWVLPSQLFRLFDLFEALLG